MAKKDTKDTVPADELDTKDVARTAETPETKASSGKAIDFSPSALLKRAQENDGDLAYRRGHYVKHAEKGWHYRYFDPRGRSAQALQAKRDEMIDRGFMPVNGPMASGKCKEYVPARPYVEIWRTTDEVMERERRKRQAYAVSLKHWLTLQANRKKARGAYMPDFVREHANDKQLARLHRQNL